MKWSEEQWLEALNAIPGVESLDNHEVGRRLGETSGAVSKARVTLGMPVRRSKSERKPLRLVTSPREIDAAIDRARLQERKQQWAAYEASKRGEHVAAE